MHARILAMLRWACGLALVVFAFGQSAALADTLYGAAHSGAAGPSTLLRIDPLTGSAVPVGPIGFDAVSGLDFHPVSEVLYGVGRRPGGGPSVLMRVDPVTGAGQFVGFTGIEGLLGSLFTERKADAATP